MNTEKRIGKIKKVHVGNGGYQDAMLGISFELGSDKEAWGCGDFWGTWGFEPDKHVKWTKQDQIKLLGETFLRIGKLMTDANVSNVNDLAGIPIEVTFEGMQLKEWRILTEVI